MIWEPGIKYSDLANSFIYLFISNAIYKLFWSFQLHREHFDHSIWRFNSSNSFSWRVSDQLDGDEREAKERGQKGRGRGFKKNSKHTNRETDMWRFCFSCSRCRSRFFFKFNLWTGFSDLLFTKTELALYTITLSGYIGKNRKIAPSDLVGVRLALSPWLRTVDLLPRRAHIPMPPAKSAEFKLR